MKRLIAATILALAFLATPLLPDTIYGRQITVTSGTAIRVATGNEYASSLFIQMKHGGTGVGYVLYADPSVTCNLGAAGTALVAELAPATATSPGGSFTYPSNNIAASGEGGIQPSYFCVDGSSSGDVVVTSWSQR